MRSVVFMKTMTVAEEIAARDFGRKAVRALARKGIRFVGMTAIPGDGPMPWANASRGYCLDDNGTGRVRSYSDVRALIEAA